MSEPDAEVETTQPMPALWAEQTQELPTAEQRPTAEELPTAEQLPTVEEPLVPLQPWRPPSQRPPARTRADEARRAPPRPAPARPRQLPPRPPARRRQPAAPPPPRAPEGPSPRALMVAGGAGILVIVLVGLLLAGVFDTGGTSSNTSQADRASRAHRGRSVKAAHPSGVTPTTPAVPVAGGTRLPTTLFTGAGFSIKYPTGWTVRADEKHYTYGTDTTIVSPQDPRTLMRVDVTSNLKTTDPMVAARPVIAAVSKQSGYQLLGLSPSDVNGNAAAQWEFLATENGALLHKIDEFIVTAHGDGLAILTQAPAAQYGALAKEFASLRQTISVR